MTEYVTVNTVKEVKALDPEKYPAVLIPFYVGDKPRVTTTWDIQGWADDTLRALLPATVLTPAPTPQTPDDVREAVARELEAWDLYDCTRVPGDLTADDFEPVDNEAVADGIIAALSAIPARPTVSAEQMQYAIGYMTMPNRHVMPGTSVVDGWLSALRAAGVVTE